ncbi:16073_t:CDS:1, partial [Racocetra fulgida]
HTTMLDDFSDVLQDKEMVDFNVFLNVNNTQVGNEFDELEQYLSDLLFSHSHM